MEERFLDLEIMVDRRSDGDAVFLRLSSDEAELTWAKGKARFDHEALRCQSGNWKAYGKILSDSVFNDEEISDAFKKARIVSQNLGIPLRFRLSIDPLATDLHDLVWEVLRDPANGELLTTQEHLLFYRYIRSLDWWFVEQRARDALRALVVIASPSNIGEYAPSGSSLSPLDVHGEEQRIRTALGNIPVEVLGVDGDPATLNSIVSKLREGFDICYLICHGALLEGEPRLYLERPDGTAEVVNGTELITRLSELDQRPRLVVLASCQSAGTGDDVYSSSEGLLTALGPRMAAAGIPAVIAMQGSITMQTVEMFMKVLFEELRRDGQIDRAVAAARGIVRERNDWWMPVLFMCLRRGQISWYDPGFTGDQPEFDRWDSLINHIRQGRCTPILGSGLLESLTGSFRGIARQWAKQYKYPMAGAEQEELPLVAQYLAVKQGEETFVREMFIRAMRKGVLRHYGHEIPAERHNAPLEALISEAGKIRRKLKLDLAEPYEVLAQLNLPIYITTNPDNLLADALTEVGKKPLVALCPGKESQEPEEKKRRGNARRKLHGTVCSHGKVAEAELPFDRDYTPTVNEPLVYHLFGHLQDPHSVVLTQDDYFDTLIGATRNRDLIPPVVRSHLVNTALLFLGFQMSDWDFRVLFRRIKNQEGRDRLKDYRHVAVQIDPSRARMMDPESARRHLERYFENAKISIFWGSAEDFLRSLLKEMERRPC